MAIRLWGSKTPGNAQDTRDITLMRNKKRVNILFVLYSMIVCVDLTYLFSSIYLFVMKLKNLFLNFFFAILGY